MKELICCYFRITKIINDVFKSREYCTNVLIFFQCDCRKNYPFSLKSEHSQNGAIGVFSDLKYIEIAFSIAIWRKKGERGCLLMFAH